MWARELGFSQIGITGVDLAQAEQGLLEWLAAGFHGDMHYMARHGLKRARPAELVPGTLRVISARMDYRPRDSEADGQAFSQRELAALQAEGRAVVSLYARGRDYHKVLRQRLQQLATRLAQAASPLGYRVFTDSAPLLEVELATRAGLGWRGKHTLALSRDAGSFFFLGEICIDMPLPVDEPAAAHCGSCSACITACPTGAIVAPYRLDARRCISYLTIEHEGAIEEALRPLMGNRIYGCDDCQLVCPWNRWSKRSPLSDFDSRQALQAPGLLQLWAWDEAQFLQQTEGSAIRRIGFRRWRRNLAVALGNGLRQAQTGGLPDAITQALRDAPEWVAPAEHALVAQHIAWALAQRAA